MALDDSATAQPTERSRELQRFLRARRESLTPTAPASRRRRTPGLRREEVAELADISSVWYARLEMGRPVSASSKVLHRLAQALQLSPDERAHLFVLAGREPPSTIGTLGETVHPSIQKVLNEFTYPAWVLGARLDLLASNRPFRLLWDHDERMRGHDANSLWTIFMNPGRRNIHVDWLADARNMVAFFRRNYGHYVGNPHFDALIEALKSSSPEFCTIWSSHQVATRFVREMRVYRPEIGEVLLEAMYFPTPIDPLQTLALCMPKGGALEENRLLDFIRG